MVARFANKNVIALGVGFSASGPLVLLMQIAVGLKSTPTHRQHVILYLSIAALVVLGLWAAVSLLFRHWDAINSTGPPAEHDAEQPLLAEETGDITGSAAAGSDDVEVERLTPVGSSMGPLSRLTPDKKMRSMPRQLAYSLLEPYEQPYLSARREFTSPSVRLARRLSSPMKLPRDGAEAGHEEAADGRGGEGSHIAEGDIQRSVSAPAEWHHRGSGDGSDAESFYTVEDHHEDGVEGGVTGMMEVGRLIWPALIAIGLQAGIALTLFPFFTYIPSSGLLGDELPKVLFFGRIFADVAGRLLPRSKFFVPSSINAVLIIALCKLTAEPLFFVYLKTPERMHSDVFIIAYIVLMWGASGYVNTAANMCAPKMVPPALKSTAAALMAIVYQSGHFVGLVVATVLNLLMFPKH